MNKRIISLLMAAVMTTGVSLTPVSSVTKNEIAASAEEPESRVISNYIPGYWGFDDMPVTERETDIYYLEDGIKKLGYSIPSDLPTEYAVPEWNDYLWSSSLIYSYIDIDKFKTGVMTAAEGLTKYVTKSGYESYAESICDVYGISDDEKSVIHYKVRFHNYAETLRKQAAKKWVKENITSGMTTKEKVEAVVRKTTYGAYGGGCDAVLGTSSGDCISYSIDSLYFFKELGIPARIRYDGLYLANDGTIRDYPNHHNVLALIDGDLYIVEVTPPGGKDKEEYLSFYKSNLTNISQNTSGMMTDGQYVYFLLNDGTLAMIDIVEFNKKLPEKWTLPTSTVINGKTYRVSKMYSSGYSAHTYYYFPQVKEIIVPKGVAIYPGELRAIGFGFRSLEKVTLNEDIHTLDGLDLNNVVVDASMTAIDTYTDASEQRISIHKFMIGGCTTVYAGGVSDEVRSAYEADCADRNQWNLIDMSDPTAHDLTLIAPDKNNDSLKLFKNDRSSAILPLSKADGTYYYPKMLPGEYTVKYTINGKEKQFPLTLTGKDTTIRLTNAMFGSLSISVLSFDSSIDDEQMKTMRDQLKITDDNGNEYKIVKESYTYNYKIYGLSDGTYNIYARFPGYVSTPLSVTVKDGEYKSGTRLNMYVYKCGDLNSDDKINNSDILQIKAHIKGITKLTDLAFLRADINGDNEVNNSDLLLMKAHMKGITRLW